MEAKLIEKYQGSLFIASSDGLNDIVSLRKTVNKLIQEFHDVPRRAGTENEKIRIIQTAASIIRSDIKDIKCRTDVYNAYIIDVYIFDWLKNKN